MYATDCLPFSVPVRVTEPTPLQEPVTPQEAKRQCGIADDVSYHDEHIQRLIAAARQQVEQDTGLVCYTGSYVFNMTEWPTGEVLTLPDIRPITAVTSIAYLDTAGASQTWSAANYALKTRATKQFIHLAYNAIWPVVRGDYHGITVTVAAGYLTVAAVPQRVKQAVLLQLHIQWLLALEADAKGQQDGYDRLIYGLMRSSYP